MSSYRRSAIVAGALCLIAAALWAKPAMLESGAVDGLAKDSYTAYLGVPFAAPRVGEARGRNLAARAAGGGADRLCRVGRRRRRVVTRGSYYFQLPAAC